VKVLALALVLIGFSAQAYAQQVELAGGYNFQNSDQGRGVRVNFNGWYASAQYDFNSMLSVSIEADNYYGAIHGAKASQQNFIAGPQLTFRRENARIRPFVYAQAGDQRSASGTVDHSFDFQAGAGFQFKLSDNWSLEVTPFEYNLATAAAGVTNSYSVKVGLSRTIWKRASD
jgi:hypothetical protein